MKIPDIRNHPNFPYFKAYYENKVREIQAERAPCDQVDPEKHKALTKHTAELKKIKEIEKLMAEVQREERDQREHKARVQREHKARVQREHKERVQREHKERVQRERAQQVRTPSNPVVSPFPLYDTVHPGQPGHLLPTTQPVKPGQPGFQNLKNPIYPALDQASTVNFPKNPMNRFNQLYEKIPVNAPELVHLPQTNVAGPAIPYGSSQRRLNHHHSPNCGCSYQDQMYRDSLIDRRRNMREHRRQVQAGNTVEKVIEYRPRIRHLPTLKQIEARERVTYDPPTMPRDKYLRQEYNHPSVKPSYKFHGMISEKEYTPRPFMNSDIPELNPYALISDDGSGYEVGKLYAYDPTSY